RHWKNELEPCDVLAVRRRGKLTAMLLDDHPANRESQSHAVRLRRNERRKYPAQLLRINPRARVFYGNGNGIGMTKLGCHTEHPMSISRGDHRFQRVVDQIEDDLSQLTPMAVHQRQFGQFGANVNPTLLRLSAQR